jgi:nicotinate-nucleotide pyrophosphorylase (carboxylating)
MKNLNDIQEIVALSLAEDVGDGDITAELIPFNTYATAKIISREPAVIAGFPWAEEVFRQVDQYVTLERTIEEGATVVPGQTIATLSGPARSLLTGERTALNWLQTLSGTATLVSRYVHSLSSFPTKLLDTRKTIPGLRAAQKYAVRCGGGSNHRMGLFDAFLIKENHIVSCGSITKAVADARAQEPNKTIEVEVETLEQLKEALAAGPEIIMLDNFQLSEMKEAVRLTAGRSKLEVSGGITLENIAQVASTGVDFISVGSLTKHVHAIDLSMRVNFVERH